MSFFIFNYFEVNLDFELILLKVPKNFPKIYEFLFEFNCTCHITTIMARWAFLNGVKQNLKKGQHRACYDTLPHNHH